ncbi:MAG: acyltransferase [Magnetovibrionaceae bacterium]
MSRLNTLKRRIKAGESPLARLVLRAHGAWCTFEVPVIPGIHSGLWSLHRAIQNVTAWGTRVFYYTPMFKSRLQGKAPRLNLYGGLPYVGGPVRISFGSDCRLSAATTITGRWAGRETPELVVGDNVGIGWQTTIAVGTRVVLEDNVRIAGRAFLAGYPGHPIDARDRAKGLPDTEDQIGEIKLERDVWLGTGVTVSAGVTIGKGTIVAAGSVVSRDLPPGVLAGGVPARVIRTLTPGIKEIAA